VTRSCGQRAVLIVLVSSIGVMACGRGHGTRESDDRFVSSGSGVWPAAIPVRPPELVPWLGPYRPGDIVIVNNERALYLMGGGVNGLTLRYPVAIGVNSQVWTGLERVTSKKEYPSWLPVSRYGEPPYERIPGGAYDNPMGARALYLGPTLWRIHGTNAPQSIGRSTSDGCIRMHNDHVADLYRRVGVGTLVFAVNDLSDPPPRYAGRHVGQRHDYDTWRW
jgi:lipoprotein-anchoring transpeptidase ErfK/SrfK